MQKDYSEIEDFGKPKKVVENILYHVDRYILSAEILIKEKQGVSAYLLLWLCLENLGSLSKIEIPQDMHLGNRHVKSLCKFNFLFYGFLADVAGCDEVPFELDKTVSNFMLSYQYVFGEVGKKENIERLKEFVDRKNRLSYISDQQKSDDLLYPKEISSMLIIVKTMSAYCKNKIRWKQNEWKKVDQLYKNLFD